MLPLPQISKKTFQDILDETIKKIPSLTDEWTDFNAHDPGITTLQVYAWLSEMQQYYGEAIGDIHTEKYLKLLGYEPQQMAISKGILTVSGIREESCLPEGTKFTAGEICYETKETTRLIKNKIVQVVRDHALIDLMDFVKEIDESYEYLFTKEDKSCFYIGFERPIDLREGLAVYFNFYEHQIFRKHIENASLKMGQLKWEIYTDQGFEEVQYVEDTTNHFLNDGYVYFKGEHQSSSHQLDAAYEPAYYLKCTLMMNDYDLLPRVNYIGINNLTIVQKDTKIRSLYLNGTGENNQEYLLTHYLAAIGQIEVLLKVDTQRWKLLKPNRDYKEETIAGLGKRISFNDKLYGTVPEKDIENIRVICYEQEAFDKRQLGKFKGYIDQSFQLENEGVYYPDLKLDVMLQTDEGIYYESYTQVKDISRMGPRDKVYQISRSGEVVFGDRHHGYYPREPQAALIITNLSTSKGANGNVKPHKINQFYNPILTSPNSNLFVTNQKDTGGGKDKESINQAIRSARRQIEKTARVINEEDYEKLVKNIPGLLIHKVKAISEKALRDEIKESHKVFIIVKPYAEEARPQLSSIYKKCIEEELEKYRLLTMEIEVVSPKYLPIDVYGCIYKTPSGDEKVIYELIRRALDGVTGNREFGENLILGKLFGALDSLEDVASIEQLSLQPADYEHTKNLAGDVIVRPNELTYLRNYLIEVR